MADGRVVGANGLGLGLGLGLRVVTSLQEMVVGLIDYSLRTLKNQVRIGEVKNEGRFLNLTSFAWLVLKGLGFLQYSHLHLLVIPLLNVLVPSHLYLIHRLLTSVT